MNKSFYTLKESSITYFFCLVAMLGAGLVLSIIVSIISSSTGVPINEVQRYDWILYVNMFLSAFIFLLVFIGINAKFKKDYLVASRLKTKVDYRLCLVAILLGIVVFLGGLNITSLYNHLFAHVFPQQDATNVIATSNFGVFILQVLLLAILPAIFEELVFRGIIYNGLRQKFSAVASIIISASFFMLIHLSIYKSFYQIILGIVLALLVYYTGSIIYGMIFHFTNNFIIILLNYISPDGSIFELVKKGELLTSSWGVGDIILSILFFALGIGAVILIFYFIKKFTFKHKNYFNLEQTSEPLNFEIDENIEVSKKMIFKDTNSNYKIWFILSIVGFIFFWIMSSCGVN